MPFRPISSESESIISESRIDPLITRDSELTTALNAIFPAFEAETVNYKQRIEQSGNLIFLPDLQRIDCFIKLLKSQNIWNLIDEIGVFRFVCWPNQKLKFPANSSNSLVFHNLDATNYNSFSGIKGNGSNGFITGGCRPPNTSGQDLHICCVSNEPTGRMMGWHRRTYYTNHYLISDGNSLWAWGNPHSSSYYYGGIRIATRPLSGSAKLFLNGIAVSTHPNPDNSLVPDVEVGILASRALEAEEWYGFTQSTISYYSVGKGLSDLQVANYSKAVSMLLAV